MKNKLVFGIDFISENRKKAQITYKTPEDFSIFRGNFLKCDFVEYFFAFFND